MSQAREGWYPDPSGDPNKLRYWNGEQWTDAYADVPFRQTAQVDSQMVPPNPSYTPYPQMSSQDRTLRLVAFIFCAISLAGWCWFIIPLAWMIPMTVRTWNIYKGTRPNTVAFGVCSILFTNLVTGVLLLVSKKDE